MQKTHSVDIMDIELFRDLALLAKTGNFSRAANLANISQPAFSRRIKALENWVGVPLVQRGRHPIGLTDAGIQMLEAGQQAVSRIQQERDHVREAMADPDRYVVTFGAPHSISWRFYPAWLQAFEESFGPIISRLRAEDLSICIEALANRELDFVIAYRTQDVPVVDTGIATESLVIGKDLLVPVCKADSTGNPIFQIGDGNAPPVPWLRFGERAAMSRYVEPLLARTDLNDRLKVVYENSMAGALRIRARDGAGVAWLPRSLVRSDLSVGVLAITGDTDWQIPLQVCLHRMRENTNSLTRKIWSFLSVRQEVPLKAKI